MSFIDSVRNIELFAIVDEYAGKGPSKKRDKFYIILRATDNLGKSKEITYGEVEDAVKLEQLILTDFLGITKFPLGMNGDDRFKFNVSDVKYDLTDKYNLITVDVNQNLFSGRLSVCAMIYDVKKKLQIASTCYHSRFQSTLYITNKKNNVA